MMIMGLDVERPIMYTNKAAALLAALLTFVAVNSVLAGDDPVARIGLQKHDFVVGEPIVVDFVVRNESAQPIQTGAVDDVRFSRLELVVRAFAEQQEVAEWCGGSSCGLDLTTQLRNPDTGEWLFQLAPGEELSARKLVVLILPPPKDPWKQPREKRGPLSPGRYVLVGSIPWVDGRIETEGVEINIVESDQAEDRQAAELVDPVFESFMGDSRGMAGISGMDPTGSVERILKQYPESIHATLARSRLLQLRAFKTMSSSGGVTPQEEERRQADQAAMLEEIEAQLRKNPDDPLKLDLLHARVRILWNLNRVDAVNKACDELIAAYPSSAYANDAQERKERLQLYREKLKQDAAQERDEE